MQQMMMPLVFMAPLIAPNRVRCKAFRLAPVAGIIAPMIRILTRQICETLPGAEVSDPWGGGHDAWKVGGKMFACIGAVREGLNVKTDSVETAEMLIAAGVAERAKYFHRSWVYLPEGAEDGEIRHRILQSYDIVRAGLTRKVQADLPPRLNG